MNERIWGAVMALTLCAAPLLAQPATAPAAPAHEATAPALAPGDDVDPQLVAALDLDEQDLVAVDFDGPEQAPMGDDGPRMAGVRDGADGPQGRWGRRGPDAGRDGGGMMGGPGGMRGHLAMIADRLKLTDPQRDKIRDIMEQQQRRGIQERADLEIANLDLHKLMRADKPDRNAIDAQVDKIARMRATLAKERIGAMLSAQDVLTPEQREQLKQMRGPGMHGRGGAPGGPGMRGRDGGGHTEH